MGEDAAGVISADFKGQNARNLEETMKALAETHGASLDEKVRAARAGEIAATEALERKKAIFQRAFARVFPGREAQFSGDDGIGFLPIALTTDQKKNFARIWKEEGGNPDDIRLTFEEFRYRDTGAPIPAEKRSDLVVEAEGLEKKLRAELIRDLPREDLNGLQIAVSLSGREKSPALASIYLASGKAPSPAVEARIKEIVKKYGAKLEAVEFTHLP
jgi:hypothetical protein